MNDFISIIIPVFNEERYIAQCIDSLLKQDYPVEYMEWIFVDGNSTDKTRKILSYYQEMYPELIHVYVNANKTVPYAMNIGICASKGKYIIRLDAHAEYDLNYISKCVKYLNDTNIDADNVGGVARTKGKGYIGECIALMLSSPFGVGNSQFRVQGHSGYVDTVPFGAFKREVFEKWGGYDTRLTRNQDNEMNYRIRKNGGKIYLANDINFTYYCRDSVRGIIDMAIKNGMWNIITMKLCPGSMGIRHFVPLAFLSSILLLILLGSFVSIIFYYILLIEVVLYLALDMIYSIKKTDIKAQLVVLLYLFPIFHLSYGMGSLKGIIKSFSKEFRCHKECKHN